MFLLLRCLFVSVEEGKSATTDFIKLKEALNGSKVRWNILLSGIQKDSTVVRELCLGDGLSKSMERTYTKLKANILSVGNYEAAISKCLKRKRAK